MRLRSDFAQLLILQISNCPAPQAAQVLLHRACLATGQATQAWWQGNVPNLLKGYGFAALVRYETFEPIHKLIGPQLFHVDVRICAFIVEINHAVLFSASSPMDELLPKGWCRLHGDLFQYRLGRVRPNIALCADLFFVRRNQEQRRANDRLGIGNDSPRRAERFHSHA